jgi:hypothetical protein
VSVAAHADRIFFAHLFLELCLLANESNRGLWHQYQSSYMQCPSPRSHGNHLVPAIPFATLRELHDLPTLPANTSSGPAKIAHLRTDRCLSRSVLLCLSATPLRSFYWQIGMLIRSASLIKVPTLCLFTHPPLFLLRIPIVTKHAGKTGYLANGPSFVPLQISTTASLPIIQTQTRPADKSFMTVVYLRPPRCDIRSQWPILDYSTRVKCSMILFVK